MQFITLNKGNDQKDVENIIKELMWFGVNQIFTV